MHCTVATNEKKFPFTVFVLVAAIHCGKFIECVHGSTTIGIGDGDDTVTQMKWTNDGGYIGIERRKIANPQNLFTSKIRVGEKR